MSTAERKKNCLDMEKERKKIADVHQTSLCHANKYDIVINFCYAFVVISLTLFMHFIIHVFLFFFAFDSLGVFCYIAL